MMISKKKKKRNRLNDEVAVSFLIIVFSMLVSNQLSDDLCAHFNLIKTTEKHPEYIAAGDHCG